MMKKKLRLVQIFLLFVGVSAISSCQREDNASKTLDIKVDEFVCGCSAHFDCTIGGQSIGGGTITGKSSNYSTEEGARWGCDNNLTEQMQKQHPCDSWPQEFSFSGEQYDCRSAQPVPIYTCHGLCGYVFSSNEGSAPMTGDSFGVSASELEARRETEASCTRHCTSDPGSFANCRMMGPTSCTTK